MIVHGGTEVSPSDDATAPIICSVMRCASSSAWRPASPVTAGSAPFADGGDEVFELTCQRLRPHDLTEPPSIHGIPAGGLTSRQTSSSCAAKSTATYESGWKKRILRVRSRLIRLAVRFAMQPLSKRSRTLAMSMRGVSTGTPTASMAATGDFTIERTTSMS